MIQDKEGNIENLKDASRDEKIFLKTNYDSPSKIQCIVRTLIQTVANISHRARK